MAISETFTVKELEKIGEEMFPEKKGRWSAALAEKAGLSAALVSNIRRGLTPISTKTEAKILAAYDKFKNANNPHYNFDGTEIGGDASFGLCLLAKDLRTNKFVGVHEVDPFKFFAHFAPKKATDEAVVQTVAKKAPSMASVEVSSDDELTENEISDRINKRFHVMETMTLGVINGDIPSVIVYGAPGVGKSYGIMKTLKENDAEFTLIKGSVSTPAIVQALFRAREGGIVVFDDSDSVFDSEESLNILKAALDSEKVRRISWAKRSPWLKALAEEEGVSVEEIQNFNFEGSVIFITNKNIKALAKKEDRMAPHFKALLSRSMFIDLAMDSTRAKMVRVKEVFFSGMYETLGLTIEEAEEVIDFMDANKDRLMEISFRMVKIIANVFRASPDEWKDIIEVTKMV